MSSQSVPTQSGSIPQIVETEFQSEQVLPIAGAHFVHDIYTATVAPLLPVLIEKLSLSLTQAGTLTAILQLPAMLNPFIGYMADKVSLRYFVILAPAVTATLISAISFANSYWAVAILLFMTGISVAAFHAPSPAMIARVAGRKVGLGMSLYMGAGELSRTVGPLIAVWAVTLWTLDGFYRIVLLGWATSLILFWRLRKVPARVEKPASLRGALPAIKQLFVPLTLYVVFRNFVNISLSTYLPTYMKSQGASLIVSGAALSILEFAGVVGALVGGTLSDRIGRKQMLLASTLGSIALMFVFLNVGGWWLVPVLLALGFTTLSTSPVMMAMVQDHLPKNRAAGNGLYMLSNFLIRPIAMVSIGYIGDRVGLHSAFLWSAMISLLAIPAILKLPEKPRTLESA
jgi:FSR family fosmidomycin resistance protein-like MFS transporter